MIVNSEYDKTVGMIDAWNTAEGLGMANDRKDIKGGTTWNAGNSLIIVLAEGEQTYLGLHPPEGEQANDRALATWEKLRALIERTTQSEQSHAIPLGLVGNSGERVLFNPNSTCGPYQPGQEVELSPEEAKFYALADQAITYAKEATGNRVIPGQPEPAADAKQEQQTGDFPKQFPKTESGRQKAARAYEAIVKTREEWRQRWDSLNADEPEPDIDDLRDAVASAVGKKYSAKRIRTFRDWGDDGYLDYYLRD